MPNAFKYSLTNQTLALKKGNFYIGTGDVGKGPTSSTGYYNGITPPAGGYTIYLNKESGGPVIYVANNDSELISLTNKIAGTSYSTIGDVLNYYNTQTDKMVLNMDYPAIVTNGLVFNLDAGFTPSYPTTNTTWYDVSFGGNNGTLVNGPTFSSTNGAAWYNNYFCRSNNPIVPADAIIIGTGYSGTVSQGSIGQVMCYNKMLSDTEVSQIYEATKSTYGL